MPVAAVPDVLRPARGAVRVARAMAAALVCVLTAAVGHLAAGGQMPAAAVGAVFAGSSAVAWLLSARRLTTGQLTGLLVLCQVGVHLAGATGSMDMSAAMMAAHASATVVSAVALTHGERFVWDLAEHLGLRLAPHELRAVGLPAWRPAAVPVVSLRSRRDARLSHSRIERGPPHRSC